MAKTEFPISVVISAVDQVSSKVQSISNRLNSATKGIQDYNKRLAQNTGLKKLQLSLSSAKKSMSGFERSLLKLGGFDQVSNSANQMAKNSIHAFTEVKASFKSMLGVIGGTGVLLGGSGYGAFRFFNSFTEDSIKTANAAKRIGISIQSLQEYEFLARKAHISEDNLHRMLFRFSRSVGMASVGKGEGLIGFQALKGPFHFLDERGRLKSFEELFGQYSDKLNKAGPRAKTISLNTIFGEDSSSVNSIAQLGSKGIAAGRRRAHIFGPLIDQKTIHDIETYNDKWIELEDSFKGVKRIVAIDLLPAMTDFSSTITKTLIENRDSIRLFSKQFADELPDNIDNLKKRFDSLKVALSPLIKIGEWLVNTFGVANLVLGALAIKIGTSLLPALWKLGTSMFVFGEALAVTPFGWFVIGSAAISVAVYELIANFDKLEEKYKSLKKAFTVQLLDRVSLRGMTHVNLPSKEWLESIFNNRIFQQIKTNYQDPFRLGPGIQPNSSSLFEKGYGFGIKEYFGKEIKDFFNEDRTGAQSAKKEEQKATITVKFKDAPAGTRVISMDGTAKVLVDMGYAGIGIA